MRDIIDNPEKTPLGVWDKLKKWNWSGFLFMLCICLLGALSNKNIPDITGCLIIGFGFGIPMSLLLAFISRED